MYEQSLVTLQPISDDMLTSKICVAVAKCEQALIQGQALMGDGPIQPVIIDTMQNNNGLNIGKGLNIGNGLNN